MDHYLFVKKIDEDQDIILDPDRLLLCRRKRLKYYDEKIYQYLQHHHHPNINPILDIAHSQNELIIIEPEIQGKSLSKIISTLSKKDKEKIFDQILNGVQFLHTANPPIIHRDLKAENIMVTDDGNVKIIDFDAAKTTHGHKSRDTVLLGTEGSAAPEQYGFGESDFRTDIFGLGKLAEVMFPEKNEFISCATAIDPNSRFQNIREMRKAFHNPLVPYSWKPFSIHHPYTIIRFCVYQLIVFFFACCIGPDKMSTNIMMFLTMELSYMLIARWTPLFRFFRIIDHKSLFIRICFYAVGIFFILFAVSFFITLLT